MRLSRLYSGQASLFAPIHFTPGLNVVIAEIRLPENRSRDTHNLGKTTLGRLLDFAFLSVRDPEFFLFKQEAIFGSFVFYLEIELADESFVTVRRGVQDASKISFKRGAVGGQDYSEIPDSQWDHLNVAFDRAQQLLDGLLDWRVLKPWPYRKMLAYLLRSQEDYQEVFQLKKFAYKHSEWKPFLAHLLGFSGPLVEEHYETEERLENKQLDLQTINLELGGSSVNVSRIEGILLLKRQEAEKKQALLDAFDFRAQDKDQTKRLVDDIDSRIAALNAQRYSLNQSRKKITTSLQDEQILFDPEEARRLFDEAGILFAGQIKKDYEQLIAFNKAITEERRAYLREERTELDVEVKRINSELNTLGKKRSEILSFLSSTDAFDKYKKFSDDLVNLRSDIISLERQKATLQRLQELRAEIRTIMAEKDQLQVAIEADTNEKNSDDGSLFASIRLFFNEIVEEVIGRKALLRVSPNQLGHLEFKAEILDERGNATSADMGHTYRKLLCVAFDLAVLRARLPQPFPRFVFHDGVFESLDDRKKRVS